MVRGRDRMPGVGGPSGTAARVLPVEVVGPVRHCRRSREVVVLLGLIEDIVITRCPRRPSAAPAAGA